MLRIPHCLDCLLTVTNQNLIHKEIKSKLNLSYAHYFSVHILISHLLSKNVKITIYIYIYITVILPFDFVWV
jgi:hypothetical protein